jgi:cyclase
MAQALSLAALPAVAGRAFAADPPASAASVVALAPDVELLGGYGGNVVVVRTSQGPVMIDGGLGERARPLLQHVRGKGPAVQTLFNTHWHWDHTGSNRLLGASGTPIIAHENTKLWMQRPIHVEWEGRDYPALPRESWPTQTFYTGTALKVGQHDFVCGHLGQAHTDGDIYVYLPQSNVLVAGDVMSVGSYPVLDWSTGGWIRGMFEATEILLKRVDDNTRIVPGSGPVVMKAQLKAQRDMFEVLTERIWQLMRKGLSDLDIVASQPTKEYDPAWGNPQQFLLSAYKGIWGHVREMRGIV